MAHSIDKLTATLETMRPKMRQHQSDMLTAAKSILSGEYPLDSEGKGKIIASVTPGGGKTLMAAILFNMLLVGGAIDSVLILVPRNSLKNQFVTGSVKSEWGLNARVVPNEGKRLHQGVLREGREIIAGSVMTIQSCLVHSKSILRWMKNKRVLVIIDEFHHLADPIDDTSMEEEARLEKLQKWLLAIEPIYNAATFRLCMSGTLRRSEAGKKVPFVEYDDNRRAKVDIKYTRRMALEARAIIPITAYCENGRAVWEEYTGKKYDVELNVAKSEKTVRRSKRILCNDPDYTWELILRAIQHWTLYRNHTGDEARMIIICNTQKMARLVAKRLMEEKSLTVALAISDNPTGQAELARFRDSGMCHILVTVDMACEGLDVPDCSHLVCLSTKRTTVWLEQTMTRIVRPNLKSKLPVENQEGFVFVPDDPHITKFIDTILDEQGETYREKQVGVARGGGSKPWLGFIVVETEKLEETVREAGDGIVPQEELDAIDRLCSKFPSMKLIPLSEKRKFVQWMRLEKAEAAR